MFGSSFWHDLVQPGLKAEKLVNLGINGLNSSQYWTALRKMNGENLVLVDKYSNYYFPDLGYLVEKWVIWEDKLYQPWQLQIIQRFAESFPAVVTDYSLNNFGFCESFFPMETTPGEAYGIETSFHNPAEPLTSLGYFLIFRVLNRNPGMLKRLEYRDNKIFYDKHQLFLFEKEPDYCYFNSNGLEELEIFFRVWEGNSQLETDRSSFAGLVGYSGLIKELGIIRIICNASEKRVPLRGAFHDNWLIEAKSEWLWKNRAQQEMFRTGTGLDAIYKANLNQLLAYSKIPGKNILPEQILALNRFSYFQICRVYLSRCLKKVHWDGSLEGQQLGSEKLLILLEDYLRFSGDWGLVQQHRQAIKRVGNWLVYQLEQFIRSKSKIGLEHLIWACASVKSLAYLWEQLSENRESHLYFKYYWVFWTKLFALLNQVYKEKLRRYQYQGIHSRPLLKDRVIKSLFQILSVGSNQRYLDGLVGLIAQNFQNVSGRPDISINDILLYGEALLREGLDYSAVIKKLIQNASPTWSWPEQTDGPNTNYVWHSACVCYQFLLFYRELFLREEEETLTLLPGFFRSGVEPGRLELKEVPTRFGLISLKTAAIGDQIQLEYSAVYRQEPEKILVNLGERYRVTYVNALYLQDNGDLELGADFKILRLKRTK